MPVNFPAHLDLRVEEYFTTCSSPTYKSPEWEPIKYTSMFWWMVGNYTILGLLISLPAVVFIGVM